MEIVIKIPDKMYEDAKSGKDIGESWYIAQVIKNGTPLPKRHGRLIDADAVLEDPYGNTYKDIDIAETIIEADKG